MVTEPEAPPRSKTVPRRACPAASPETRRRGQRDHQMGDRGVGTAQENAVGGGIEGREIREVLVGA